MAITLAPINAGRVGTGILAQSTQGDSVIYVWTAACFTKTFIQQEKKPKGLRFGCGERRRCSYIHTGVRMGAGGI